MKTFDDLEFTTHPNIGYGFSRQAVCNFDNGYGVSVITGYEAYQSDGNYEVAILFNDQLCYTTDITDNVLTYQSPSDINDIMKKLQQL